MPQVFLRQVSRSDGDLLADLRVRAMKESLEAVGRFDPHDRCSLERVCLDELIQL
jgi:hypothetical protein